MGKAKPTQKNKPGRPRTLSDHAKSISAWLDYSDYAAVMQIAKRDGVSKSELVRTYIVWGVENDKRTV